MTISLFIPCLVDQAFPETAVATVRVLERLGHSVNYDNRQTCCGQAPFNAGFRDEPRSLAIRFVKIFRDCELIVAPSGSCVSMVKHHYGELDLPDSIHRDWKQLRERIWELSSFIVDKLSLTNVGAVFPHSVTYHSSCHLHRDLGVINQPLSLLRAVEEIDLREIPGDPECCGFGGAFSAKYRDLSQSIADRRVEKLLSTDAEYIAGADDSCLSHIAQGLKRKKSSSKAIHIAQILASRKDNL